MGQPGFFDLDERYQRLSENGDPLVKLAALIDFEAFRPKLVTALKRSDGSKGGRPPYDPVLMFKILILQTLYTLSDDATEFQIRDRLSFMRFLGLGFEDAVPDATPGYRSELRRRLRSGEWWQRDTRLAVQHRPDDRAALVMAQQIQDVGCTPQDHLAQGLAAGQDAERRHQARQTGGSDAHRLEFDLAQAPALTRRAG